MREIKFRAWVQDSHEMHTVECIQFGGDGEVESVEFGEACDWDEQDGGTGFYRPSKQCILMQYTGLKDKNGVEIYEGDIIQIGEIGMEVYSDICYTPHLINDALQRSIWIEVIGNIYEDPLESLERRMKEGKE